MQNNETFFQMLQEQTFMQTQYRIRCRHSSSEKAETLLGQQLDLEKIVSRLDLENTYLRCLQRPA